MDGKEVFKEAIKGMYSLITLLIQQMGISLKDIDYFVFHQANKRILQSLAEKFEIEESKILMAAFGGGLTSGARIFVY